VGTGEGHASDRIEAFLMGKETADIISLKKEYIHKHSMDEEDASMFVSKSTSLPRVTCVNGFCCDKVNF
jgi:hypothetical protein